MRRVGGSAAVCPGLPAGPDSAPRERHRDHEMVPRVLAVDVRKPVAKEIVPGLEVPFGAQDPAFEDLGTPRRDVQGTQPV